MRIVRGLLPSGTRQISAVLFPTTDTDVCRLSLRAAVKPRSSISNQLHGTCLPHCMVRNELLKELSRCLQFHQVEPPLNHIIIKFDPLSLSRIENPEAITMTAPEILTVRTFSNVFVSEISTSYLVQCISVRLAWILQHFNLPVFLFDLIILSIFRQIVSILL
jgi:hypothetical protein